MVLVDELRTSRIGEMDSFLADVRAKAAVDHPLIGSVYEAVVDGDACYYAHELLPGATLLQQRDAGVKISPGRLAHILRRVAEAHIQHETLGQATAPSCLDAIHLDEHGVIRLKNLTLAGERSPGESRRDLLHLGQELPALLADGQPGATRMLTVLAWMRGEKIDDPLTWAQTRDLCMQVDHQLADPLSVISPTRKGARGGAKSSLTYLAPITAVVLLAIAVLAIKLRPPITTPPPRASLPPPVMVVAGVHPTPDGLEESLPAFQIAAHETTIGQYDEFLGTLAILAKDGRDASFDARDQPEEKTSHQPDDWPALLAAAKTKGTWRGKSVTLDSPVVGVDWWDAAAYAEWKKARLPTQQEWFAAVSTDVTKPSSIPPGQWLPVTATTSDRTPTGLIGMAGSVSEWTAKPAPNPANPLGEKLWVIIGGSYAKPGTNALTREWTVDRSQRRPDLGFRVVSDPE